MINIPQINTKLKPKYNSYNQILEKRLIMIDFDSFHLELIWFNQFFVFELRYIYFLNKKLINIYLNWLKK